MVHSIWPHRTRVYNFAMVFAICTALVFFYVLAFYASNDDFLKHQIFCFAQTNKQANNQTKEKENVVLFVSLFVCFYLLYVYVTCLNPEFTLTKFQIKKQCKDAKSEGRNNSCYLEVILHINLQLLLFVMLFLR